MGYRKYNDLSEVPMEFGDPIDSAVAGSADDFSRGSGKSIQDLIDLDDDGGADDRVTVINTPAELVAAIGTTAWDDDSGDTLFSARAVEKNNTAAVLTNANRSEAEYPYSIFVVRDLAIRANDDTNKSVSAILSENSGDDDADGTHVIFVNTTFTIDNPDPTAGSEQTEIYAFTSEWVDSDGSLPTGFSFGEENGRPGSFFNTGSGATLRALLEDSRSAMNLFGCVLLVTNSSGADQQIRWIQGDVEDTTITTSTTNDDAATQIFIYQKPDSVVRRMSLFNMGYVTGTRMTYALTNPVTIVDSTFQYVNFEVADNRRVKLFGVTSVGDFVITFREASQGQVSFLSKNNRGEGWAKLVNFPGSSIFASDDLDGHYRAANTGSSNSVAAQLQRVVECLQYAPDYGAAAEGVAVRYRPRVVQGDDDPGVGGDWHGATSTGSTMYTIYLDSNGQINETSAFVPDTGETAGVISHAIVNRRGLQFPIRILNPTSTDVIFPVADGQVGSNTFSIEWDVDVEGTSNVNERHFFSLFSDGTHGTDYTLGASYYAGTGDNDYRNTRGGQKVDPDYVAVVEPIINGSTYSASTKTAAGVLTDLASTFATITTEVDGVDLYAAYLYAYYAFQTDNDISESSGDVTILNDLEIGGTAGGTGVRINSGTLELRCGSIVKDALITGIQDGSSTGNLTCELNSAGPWGLDVSGVDASNRFEFTNPLTGTGADASAAFSNCTLINVEITLDTDTDVFLVFENVDGIFTIDNDGSGDVNVLFDADSDASNVTLAESGGGNTNIAATLTFEWGVDLGTDGAVFVMDAAGTGTEAGSDFLNSNTPVTAFDSGTSGTVSTGDTEFDGLADSNDLRIIFIKPGYVTGIFDFDDVSTLSSSTITIVPVVDGLYNVNAADAVSGASIDLTLQGSNAGIDARTNSGATNGPTQGIPAAQKFVTNQIMDGGITSTDNAYIYAQSVGNNGSDAAFTYQNGDKIQFNTDYWDFAPASGDTRAPHYLSIYPLASQAESDLLSTTPSGSLNVSIVVTQDSVVDYGRFEVIVDGQTTTLTPIIEGAIDPLL